MLGLALELGLEMFQESVVKVLATKMGVTSSSLDSKYTTRDIEERDIKSSSTQIENQDILLNFGLLIQAIGNGSGSRLIDDTQDFKAGNGASVLGGQTLRIVEVSRNTDRNIKLSDLNKF